MARIIDSKNTNVVEKISGKISRNVRITCQALSHKLDLLCVYICRGSVSRIDYGVRTVTDTELLAIARLLAVSINRLFVGTNIFSIDWLSSETCNLTKMRKVLK